MSLKLNSKAILLAKLTEKELYDLANFNCGDDEMNCFLKDESLIEQEYGMNTTMLLYYTGKLACFYSICTDSLKLTDEELEQIEDEISYSTVPAIKIARLGRDISFNGLGLGKCMIKHVIHQALEIDENLCGVRMITLDAYPHRVDYYKSLGFKENLHRMYQGKNKSTVSMRYDIYSEIF